MSDPRAVIVTGVLFLVGCAFESPSDKLRIRSGFDLSCPKEQLRLTPLETVGGVVLSGEPSDYAKTVGVEGCGRKSSYLKLPDGTWMKNAENSEASPK